MKVESLIAAGCLLALAGCGGGNGSLGSAFEVMVPFQTVSPHTFSAGSGDGPATSTAQFTNGVGIVATDTQPADTALNTVTITLDGANGLQNIAVSVGTAAGSGVAGTTTPSSGPLVEDAFSVASLGDLPSVLQNVASGQGPFVIIQGSDAVGLKSSLYGLWAANTGGTNYNVGVFALGKETTAADMATLAAVGAPVSGVNQTTLTYNGATVGFGSYTTLGGTVGAPFVFTGTSQVVANFATSMVTTVSMSAITTQDVNDNFAGPTLTTLTNTAAIPITSVNKYSGALTGMASNGGAPFAITGPVNGTLYGPLALETAGTYTVGGGAVKLIGAFAGGPSHQ